MQIVHGGELLQLQCPVEIHVHGSFIYAIPFDKLYESLLENFHGSYIANPRNHKSFPLRMICIIQQASH